MSDIIRMHETGGPSVLTVEPNIVGTPGTGQVRIRYAAIGVNFVDTMFRDGTFKVALPFVTGVAGAGEVVETGPDVDHLTAQQLEELFQCQLELDQIAHVAELYVRDVGVEAGGRADSPEGLRADM